MSATGGCITSTNIQQFTHFGNLPIFARWTWLIRRKILSWLGRATPSNYTRRQYNKSLSLDRPADIGYILLEFIDEIRGEMLSCTWTKGIDDPTLRSNLFHDLSRIFLSLSQHPLPKIGPLTINNNEFLNLTNQPLSVEVQHLENEKIPTDIPRDYTYTTVDSYIIDTLGYHDNRFREQPNAVNNSGDCAYQLAILTAM